MKKTITLILILFSSYSIAEQRGLDRSPNNIGTQRALIIGINQYNDPDNLWKPLKTPINDATALAQLLKEKYNFADVTLLTNANRDEIIDSLDKLDHRVTKDDSVLIYYAGHGYLDESTHRGYWIPSDAVGTRISSFVRNSTVKDEISIIASRAKHTLIIADSCFSGSLLTDQVRGAVNLNTNIPDFYKKVSQRKSVQVLTAGGNEFVDDSYANSGHSPFSYFLLKELRYNKEPLSTLSELANNVMKSVANNVKQAPIKGTLYGVGDELGEFVFINGKSPAGRLNTTNNKVLDERDLGESIPNSQAPYMPGMF